MEVPQTWAKRFLFAPVSQETAVKVFEQKTFMMKQWCLECIRDNRGQR